MLDDFRKSSTTESSRKRFGSSVAIALALYGGGGAAIVYATAGVRQKVEEELQQVEFAPPPEPEPPAPEQKATPEPPKPKPKVKKTPKLDVPKEISDKVLAESDKALSEAGDVGPVDGLSTGGGTGTAPPPPPPPKKAGPVVKPVDAGSNRYDRLKYPPAAQRKGIEGAVMVQFDVLENGTVGNVHILSGPVEFHEVVLKAAATWRFTPAKQDGKAIRYKGMTKRVVFRLEDA